MFSITVREIDTIDFSKIDQGLWPLQIYHLMKNFGVHKLIMNHFLTDKNYKEIKPNPINSAC